MRDLLVRTRKRVRAHVLDVLQERGLVRGVRVEFLQPGVCALRPFEDALPGPGQVLIETLASVVSAGTERTLFSGRAPAEFPLAPGYSLAGRVLKSGPGAGIQPGQVVAAAGPHASLHVCGVDAAVVVPQGVPAESAAFMHIAFVAMQGVRKAAIEPGERVVVLGAGVVGQLAAQLAAIAGGRVAIVARSQPRLSVAQACGMREVRCASDADALADLSADVVIEATGDPEAIHRAVSSAKSGARVVLLGSTRGAVRDFPLDSLVGRQAALIGAHARNIPAQDPAPTAWTWRRECEVLLSLMADGRLTPAPLVTRRARPDDAPVVYADLARPDDKSVAVLFDWTIDGPWRARVEGVSPLRVAAAGLRHVVGRTRPRPAYAGRRQDGQQVRFGLVGCGEIAAESAAALAAAANATVTFTMDPNLDLARSLAAATSGSSTSNLDELLSSPLVDVVLVSTPHHLHAPVSIAALEAGKHVLVEKPMAVSVAECDRMIEKARACGKTLSTFYCQRFDPRVQRAKSLLLAGAIGEVLGTRIVFAQRRGPEYWTKGLTGRTVSDWRSRRETAGGGVLIMNACHLLDWMTWLVSKPVVEVSSLMATLGQPVEVEDTLAMSYRYEGGSLGSLEATTAVVGPGRYEQVIWGSQGELVLAPTLRLWPSRTVDGYEAGRWHTVGPLAQASERRQFIEAFAEALLEGGAPPVLAHEARDVQAVIEAAYTSAFEGRAVRIPTAEHS